MDFIRKKVHEWCDEHPGERFAARDLFGGENADWRGTPLQAIYKNRLKQQNLTLTKAEKQAGIDVGWLLKQVLSKDAHDFEQYKDRVKHYRRL